LLGIVGFVGFLWLFSGPWIARGVFTSENALRTDRVDSYFNTDRLTMEAFDRIKGEIEAIPENKNKATLLYDYIKE